MNAVHKYTSSTYLLLPSVAFLTAISAYLLAFYVCMLTETRIGSEYASLGKLCSGFHKEHGEISRTRLCREPDVVAHDCDPRAWEVEAGRSGVQIQPQIHNEFEASLSCVRP